MDELTRHRKIEERARSLLGAGRITALLTPHFLQQAHSRRGFRWSELPLLTAKLALLAAEDPGADHMALIGHMKVVYKVEETTGRTRDEPLLKVVFKTVMPKEYKHNPVMKARTIWLGEVL